MRALAKYIGGSASLRNCIICLLYCTDYGRSMKPFFMKMQNWGTKFGQINFGIITFTKYFLGYTWLRAQKIYKLRQTKLSQFVHFSLVLREREETKTKYSAPKP